MKRFQKMIPKGRWGIAISVAAIISLLYFFGSLDSWDRQLSDRFFTKQADSEQIIIVAVDDLSIEKIGQWPWPRETFAKLVDELQGARAIAFDVLFSEPSRVGPDDDATFVTALRNSETPVVLGVEYDERGNIGVEPLEIFREQTLVGYVNIIKDSDGTIRRLEAHKSEDEASLSHAVWQEGENGVRIVRHPEELLINYHGPAETFLTISLSDVLDKKIPESVFADNYVFVGSTAQSLQDIQETPFGLMPGVEVHVNALETLLSRDFLVPLPFILSVLLLVFVAVVGAFIVSWSQTVTRGLVMGGIGFVLILVVAAGAFTLGYVLPTLYMITAFLLSGGASLLHEYITESKQRQFVQNSFKHYVSPEVVSKIMRNPDMLTLGGENKELTIFFSDIRSFSTFSEKLTPEELVEVMNEYFSLMTDIIMKHGGVVDKYIGDAIMAFWGAPVDSDTHGTDTLNAVSEMKVALLKFNKDRKAAGKEEIAIGIGVSTGNVIVGNMGSDTRFNYTIMGDEVNVAARLEGSTKTYGAFCLVSDETKQRLLEEDSVMNPLREVDTIVVKGKSKPKKIFELYDADVFSPKYIEKFESALALYYKGSWNKAVDAFERLTKEAEDKAVNVLLERCREYQQNPPSDWQGVYWNTSK